MQAWKPDEKRFSELLLYIAQKCAHHGKFGAVKLNKILFYADSLAFALLGRPITGFAYYKLQKGPAPRGILPVRERMEISGELKVYQRQLPNDKKQIRIAALRDPDISLFSPEEIGVVDRVIAILKEHDAQQVSELTHLDIGWKAAALHETIPYGAVFLSDEALTDEQIKRIQRFAEEHGHTTA